MGSPAMVLTGGEPFLYPELKSVLDLCQVRGLQCKIATNGTRLDAETVEALVNHGCTSLQISLDTLDPALYARTKGCGADVHQRVLEGIQRCVATEKLHVVVSAVAHRETKSGLGDLMKFCHNNGLATFTVYHWIPFGRAKGADGGLMEQDFVETLDDLMGTFERLPNHWAVDVGFPWAIDSPLARKWQPRLDLQILGCIAAKTSLTFLTDGTAVPCVCLESPNFSCGNIGEQTLQEIWNAPVMKYFRGEVPVDGCQSCSKFAFCLGGCRALAYLKSERMDAPDPVCAAWGAIEESH